MMCGVYRCVSGRQYPKGCTWWRLFHGVLSTERLGGLPAWTFALFKVPTCVGGFGRWCLDPRGSNGLPAQCPACCCAGGFGWCVSGVGEAPPAVLLTVGVACGCLSAQAEPPFVSGSHYAEPACVVCTGSGGTHGGSSGSQPLPCRCLCPYHAVWLLVHSNNKKYLPLLFFCMMFHVVLHAEKMQGCEYCNYLVAPVWVG